MYANFYNKNNKCLYSIEVQTINESDYLANMIFNTDKRIEYKTDTEDTPIGIIITKKEVTT